MEWFRHIIIVLVFCSHHPEDVHVSGRNMFVTSVRKFHFKSKYICLFILHIVCIWLIHEGPDSSVGIATRYWLDGPGIESRWEARFSAPVQTGPEAHAASYTMGTGSLTKIKRPGSGVEPPPQSNAEVEERVEPYIYSHSGPSWPVLGRTLPLHLPD